MSQKIRVGILYGGQSAEHEISILSARNVLAALDRERFDPVLIGIDKSGKWLTQDEQRLLASARDPRQVRVEPGLPAPRAQRLGERGAARGVGIECRVQSSPRAFWTSSSYRNLRLIG